MASPSVGKSTPPDRDTAPVASVRGVSHNYGATRALDALDLDIPAGGMVGLIGPDGVGKSTLMGLIAGSKKIQAGSVNVLGGDMAESAHRDAACPRIAFMPQGLGKNLYLELKASSREHRLLCQALRRARPMPSASAASARLLSTPRDWGRSPTAPPASSPAA